VSLWGMNQLARGAFPVAACAALIAVGCGGRTSGGGGGTSGSGSGETGSVGASASAISGSATGSDLGIGSGLPSTGAIGSGGSAGTNGGTGEYAQPSYGVGFVCTAPGMCTCDPGWTECAGNIEQLTCVTEQSVQTDPNNCGHCGIQCPTSAPSCESGSCLPFVDASANGTDASADAGPPPPSCAAGGLGLTNCGPGGSGTESCCTSLEVTGGTYYRTYTNDGSGPTGEADPAAVSSFRLDKYAVTVGRFRQFVSAWDNGNGYTPPAGSGKHAHLNNGNGLAATGGGYEPGWLASDDSNIVPNGDHLAPPQDAYATWTASPGSQENLPINFVTWYASYAFCIWDGGFLPSEAEWEYAAAGGNQQREYPWGSTAPGTGSQYAIYADTTTGECFYPSFTPCAGAANIAPVAYAAQGAGLWGQLDLAGDVWEWNIDSYSFSYVDPCTDCAGFAAASIRAVRGGDFGEGASHLLSSTRYDESPFARLSFIGFRCARSP
jgi:formylglycine-generating enzyme